jgi:hypothetical protein
MDGLRVVVGWGEALEIWTNMKRREFSVMAAAGLMALAAMISTAPLVHAQTDVEAGCASSGGQYTSEVVRPHWNESPALIETCCTGKQCTTYRDGVQGGTYTRG